MNGAIKFGLLSSEFIRFRILTILKQKKCVRYVDMNTSYFRK